jgi:hypothetical protein
MSLWIDAPPYSRMPSRLIKISSDAISASAVSWSTKYNHNSPSFHAFFAFELELPAPTIF